MFDNRFSFFENKHRRVEYDKRLRKLKNCIKPKEILFKLEVPPKRSSFLRSCPLELKPTKLSDSSLEYAAKETPNSPISYRKAKCNYESNNQQNLDDSILSGLQTVIDLCGLLEACDKETELKFQAQKGKKKVRNKKPTCCTNLLTKKKSLQLDSQSNSSSSSIERDDIQESRDSKKTTKLLDGLGSSKLRNKTATCCTTLLTKKKLLQLDDQSNSSSSSHESNDVQESRDSNKTTKPSNEISSFRKLLIRASRSCIISKSPFKSASTPSVLTPSLLSNQSSLHTLNAENATETATKSVELPRELQIYACCKGPKKKMKPIQEEPRVCSNKPSAPGLPCAENERPCGEAKPSCKSQKPCGTADSPCKNQMAQTSKSREPVKTSSQVSKRSSLQSITGERHPSTAESSTGLVGGQKKGKTAPPKCLESKCFPPLEIVPDDGRKSLSKRTFTCEDRSVVHPEYVEDTDDFDKPIPTRHTAIYDPSILCNKEYTTPVEKSQVEVRKPHPGVPLVQPVLGFCSSAKCGGDGYLRQLKSIKYAMVKISEFSGFSTYEIMKPYEKKPKNLPTVIAEIFVTSAKKDYIVKEDPPGCVCEPPRVSSISIQENSQTVEESQSDFNPPCQCKPSNNEPQKSSRTSHVSKEESVQEPVGSKEIPSCCKHASTPVAEETKKKRSKHKLSKTDVKSESQTKTPEPADCECQSETLIHPVPSRELDVYRQPSTTEKPFRIYSKEGKINSSQIEIGSGQRSPSRRKSTHFQEHV